MILEKKMTALAAAVALVVSASASAELIQNGDKTLTGYSDVKLSSVESSSVEPWFGGGEHAYGNVDVTAVDQTFSDNYLGYLDGQTATDAQGGAMYLYVLGTGSQRENTVYTFEDVVFSGNMVRTNSNQGNRASAYGGAVTIKGGSTTFLNTTFTNNQAVAESDQANATSSSSDGGGSAAGGAVYIDSVRSTNNYAASVTFAATRDIVNAGNTVHSGLKNAVTDAYGTKTRTAGGFLYMDRGVTATFDVAAGATYTVGVEGAWKSDANMDSIASAVRVNDDIAENTITKTGAGLFVMNGSLNDYLGLVNVHEGTMRVTSDWAIANTVTVEGGTLELGNVSFTNVVTAARYDGDDIVNKDSAGQIVVEGGVLKIDNATLTSNAIDIRGGLVQIDSLTTTGDGNITMSAGMLDLTLDQVFGKTSEGGYNTTMKSAFEVTGGTLDFRDETIDKTWLQSVLSGKNFSIVANVVADDQPITSVTADDLMAGAILADATLAAGKDAATVTVNKAGAGVQTVTSTSPLTALNIEDDFTLIGNGTKVVLNEAVDGAMVSVTAGKTLTLGLDDGTGGGTFAGAIKANEASVNVAGGDFTVQSGITTKTLAVGENASLTTTALVVTGGGTISGSLDADSLMSTAPSTDEGASQTSNLANLVMPLALTGDTGINLDGDASLRVVGADLNVIKGGCLNLKSGSEVTAVVDVFNGGVLSTQTDTTAVDGNAVAYIGDTVTIGSAGQINVGEASTGANGAITIGSDGILTVNAAAFSEEKAAIVGALVVSGGTVAFDNLTTAGSFKLADRVTGLTTVETDNVFLNAVMDETDQGIVNVSANAAVSGNAQLDSAFVKVLNGYGDQANRNVLAAIGQKGSSFVSTEGELTSQGVAAAAEYLALPVTAGTYNVAYDAAEQVNRAIGKRSIESQGMGVWADVFYSSNEAETIYGGQGYSADIYGGVIGFDATFSCGAKLGAALTIGSADADSEKSVSRYQNDADFWGLSVYTGKSVADTSLYISADASYLWLDNDVDGAVAGVSTKESIDSNVFTVGLRADWTAYEGVVFVVPHAGVRYTNIDVDDYRGIKADSMNVLELPVGVKVAGVFEPTAGWKLVPSVDFTVTPQVGDTSVETLVGDMDVIDNLYNTTVGIEAVNGSFAFGLSGAYGFGSGDRQNAAVNATVRYAF